MLSIVLMVFASATVVAVLAAGIAAYRPRRTLAAASDDGDLDVRARRSGL